MSIVQNDLTRCYLCNKKTQLDRHHIYNGGLRNISDRNGFWVMVCRICHRKIHDTPKLAFQLKQECQYKYEESYSREEFMQLARKNYL